MSRFLSLSRIIVTAAVILASAAPLVIVPWFIFPFVTGKTLLIELAAIAALPFWGALLLLDPKTRPRRHPLIWVLGVQVLILILAGIFGADPGQSFWGRDERMMGIFTLLSLLTLFGMALAVFCSGRARRRILLLAAAVGSVNLVWGILERVFPGFWSDFRGGSIRSVGLIGNPIFYAGYALGIVFLAVALASEAQTRFARVLLGAVAAAGAVAVLFSGTRGAELGLFAGAGLALAWIGIRAPNLAVRRGVLSAFIAGAVLTAVLTLTASGTEYNPILEPFVRLRSAFSASETTAVQRLLLWQTAWDGIRERPFLGWGPENFDYLFDAHFKPRFLRYTLRETFADRPHNAFIEAATDGGMLGFLAFIAVQGFYLATVFKLHHRDESIFTCTALVGFLVASDIHLLFAFDTVPTLWTTLLVSGWLVFRTSDESLHPKKVYYREARAIVPIAAALSLVLIIAAVIRPAMAFAAFHRAIVADPQSQFEKWKSNLEGAVRLSQPFQDSMRYRAGAAIFGAVGDRLVPEDRVTETLELGIKFLKQAVSNRPRDYASRFTLGNLLLLSAISGQSERFAEAEKEFLRAAELSPRRQSTYIQLGNLKIVSGDPSASLAYYQKSVDLDPDVGEPHWYLGRGLLKAGDSETAAKEFSRAWELGFRPKIKNEIREAASLLFSFQRLDLTILLYERAVDLFPDNPELWAETAAAYATVGDTEKARAAVRRAVELDPSFAAEAETFLNLLDSGVLSRPAEGE